MSEDFNLNEVDGLFDLASILIQGFCAVGCGLLTVTAGFSGGSLFALNDVVGVGVVGSAVLTVTAGFFGHPLFVP
jgi:hypothetical protein